MVQVKEFDAIVFHSPCPDGTGALWCANHFKPIDKQIPCKAGVNPTESLTGLTVCFVDLCPSKDYLFDLVKVAKHVVILDHHKSSEKMIMDNFELFKQIPNLYIEFDMGRSGCQITWDYFFDNSPRPFFIDYMGDRDLWTWKLPNSKEINTGLWELGYIDSKNLNKLTGLLEDSEAKLKELQIIGKIIGEKNKKEIDYGAFSAIETVFKFDGIDYRVWLGGNINPTLKSDLGNVLCSKKFKDGTLPDFSAVWQYDPKSDEWWISLRGIESRSPDLSVISTKFGGGGHPMASGITLKSPPKGLKELFIF